MVYLGGHRTNKHRGGRCMAGTNEKAPSMHALAPIPGISSVESNDDIGGIVEEATQARARDSLELNWLIHRNGSSVRSSVRSVIGSSFLAIPPDRGDGTPVLLKVRSHPVFYGAFVGRDPEMAFQRAAYSITGVGHYNVRIVFFIQLF
jgi:hypothetical protein